MLEPKHIVSAVESLGCLAMFPSSPAAREEIMRLIERIVAEHEQLDWLVRTMIDQVGTWHGPAELRAVFCTRFRPADGVEKYSALPGFTAGDIEAENLALPRAPTRKQLADPEFTAKIIALAEQKRLQ